MPATRHGSVSPLNCCCSNLLSDALPDVSPDQWRALQAMPIAIGADHLDIAIPSQWRDQEWQHLIDQLPDQHRTIRLHPAIEADLQKALGEESSHHRSLRKLQLLLQRKPPKPNKRILKT